MPKIEIDLDPVDFITTDAVGQPGQRVFYIQGRKGDQVVTLLVEKVQIQTLSVGLEEFLVEIKNRQPQTDEGQVEYDEKEMHILPPLDPLFRIGELGLGYDTERDLLILVAKEIAVEGVDSGETGVVRFWCTRAQLKAMCRWGLVVAGRGRPTCPQCGEPMDPAGHFCPKKNGHKH
jgi:uncharacterized repeat protein (TIGR03847 family)